MDIIKFYPEFPGYRYYLVEILDLISDNIERKISRPFGGNMLFHPTVIHHLSYEFERYE